MQPGEQQRKIFDYLKSLLAPEQNLAEEIGKILFLSNDSAYRRLRGETPLTVDELLLLCNYFKVSSDQLLNLADERMVMFQVNRAEDAPGSLNQFANGMLSNLSGLRELGIVRFLYASKDLPIFHSFLLPDFFAFKYHFWMHVILRDPTFQERHFSSHLADQTVAGIMHQCTLIYNQVPSLEIWNSESLNSTLAQIDFYRHNQHFGSAAELKGLYDMLNELMVHVEKQAEAGTKYSPGENPSFRPENFQLFYNPVTLSDNTMLIQTKSRKLSIHNYAVLHYLACQNQAFCQTVENDLNNMVRMSTKLSSENVRQRSKFFNQLHDKVAWYKKQV